MARRVVDSDSLLFTISSLRESGFGKRKCLYYLREIIINNTIELEDLQRGEWLWSPRDADGTVSGCCSNCSFSHLFVGGHTAQYNFCPHCGARMKGADDEEVDVL